MYLLCRLSTARGLQKAELGEQPMVPDSYHRHSLIYLKVILVVDIIIKVEWEGRFFQAAQTSASFAC